MTYPKLLQSIGRSWAFPTKLSAGVLLSVTILFVTALGILFTVSHNAIEKESLAKAQETLNGTVNRIENMLHGVEVATTNMQWNVEHHLDDPNMMSVYTRELLRHNPHIVGCAIALEPGFYDGKGELFHRYSFRDRTRNDSILTSGNPMEIEPFVLSNSPYVAHNWYNIPMKVGELCWIRPHAEGDEILSTVVTCSTPLRNKEGRIVGVMATDIEVDWLSKTVLSTKPYPNSYCCMLGVQGTYLIHPDSTRLYHTFVTDIVKADSTNVEVKELVESMLKGENGCRAVNLFGKDSYVLYEALNAKHWSACIICPESDIFYANERLRMYATIIMILGLLFILVFCFLMVKMHLKPLEMLADEAERIAKGEYSLTIKPTTRKDEIGSLQHSFIKMHKALSARISELKQLTEALQQRHEELNEIYAQVENANEAKTLFIHEVADKMLQPVKLIESSVRQLKERHKKGQLDEMPTLMQTVLKQIKVITNLLEKLGR